MFEVRKRMYELSKIVFESSDSESDPEDEDEAETNMFAIAADGTSGEKKPRVELFIPRVVDRYSDEDFRSHFRITRKTFHGLENVLAPTIRERTGDAGHPFTDPRKQILLSLWILGNQESYRSVCNLFDVGRHTGLRCVRRVVDALVTMAPRFIRWPALDTQVEVAAVFKRSAGFPGVIGCIDGCHINIPQPTMDPASYINRHSNHSVVLQGICGVDMKFIHCYMGQVGSVHDARVLRLSEVNNYLHDNRAEWFLNDDVHILGDAAYPVSIHLMPPFKDNGHLTDRQKIYNTKLSSTRMVIERAFGHLKGRWRRLKMLNMARVDLIPKTILACCVLHNICILQKDPLFDLNEVDEDDQRNIIYIQRIPDQQAGTAKRNQIMNQLRVGRG